MGQIWFSLIEKIYFIFFLPQRTLTCSYSQSTYPVLVCLSSLVPLSSFEAQFLVEHFKKHHAMMNKIKVRRWTSNCFLSTFLLDRVLLTEWFSMLKIEFPWYSLVNLAFSGNVCKSSLILYFPLSPLASQFSNFTCSIEKYISNLSTFFFHFPTVLVKLHACMYLIICLMFVSSSD